MRIRVAVALMLFTVVSASGFAQEATKDAGPHIYSPDAIQWKPGPPSLPKGAMMAVLEGDPGKDGPFVFRVKLPDGYRVPPHMHPKTERVTVISGAFFIGEGDKFDAKKGHPMTAGTFGYWPAAISRYRCEMQPNGRL